jgi:hypothetical protein
MSILDTLERPIAFHRIFVEWTGSVTAALMLSQAVYWTKRTSDAGGWFYKTQDDWMEETGLTRREQETARKHLRKCGLLVEKRVGIPAKLHYRLKVENLQTRMADSANLDCTNPPNSSGGKRQSLIAETTAEITAETKKGELKGSVKTIFSYYLQQTGRNPKLYTLTDQRMEKGLARLRDCLKKTDGDISKAEELMRICVDNLAASDFHTGKNDRNREYTDWIAHLFKSTEKLEWWLEQ